MGPRVSVVIPARDEEQEIELCLESLRGQRFRDFEVIVVDNGSTDVTQAIARRYGCRVITEARPGVSFAPPDWLELIVRCCGPNFAVRRAAFERAGGFKEGNHFYRAAEDLQLSLKLEKEGYIQFHRGLVVHTSPRKLRGGSFRYNVGEYPELLGRHLAGEAEIR